GTHTGKLSAESVRGRKAECAVQRSILSPGGSRAKRVQWTKQRRRGWRSAPVLASAHRGALRQPANRKRGRGREVLSRVRGQKWVPPGAWSFCDTLKAPDQKPGAFSRCIFQGALSSVAQVGAVRGDDLLVPVEAVLAAAGQSTVAVVVLVHVDEAVALFHLAGGSRHQVDGAPHGVAQHRQAVLVHRLDELTDVGPHIFDAVAVVDAAVGLHGIVGAQAVLHNEEGLL